MLTEQDIAEAKRALKELADEAQGNGNSEGWIAAQERPIRAVIAAHEAKAAPAVPQEWKLVPVEPTPDMEGAGRVNMDYGSCTARQVWSAMLAAAPAATSQEQWETSPKDGEKWETTPKPVTLTDEEMIAAWNSVEPEPDSTENVILLRMRAIIAALREKG